MNQILISADSKNKKSNKINSTPHISTIKNFKNNFRQKSSSNIHTHNINYNNQNQEFNDTQTHTEKKQHTKLIAKKMTYLFSFSTCFAFILFSFYMHHLYILNQNKKSSNRIAYNYQTLKLYSNDSLFTNYKDLSQKNYYTKKYVIGEIKIPSLNISYPIFSILDDETLKIAPCIFSGKMPPEKNNLCIAGHNYNNNLFFSNISKLKKEDKIYIYDNKKHEYIYSVFANYEVKTDDLSPISSNNFNELTLITCNNINNNRIIIKGSF